jgi:hypothetical protein
MSSARLGGWGRRKVNILIKRVTGVRGVIYQSRSLALRISAEQEHITRSYKSERKTLKGKLFSFSFNRKLQQINFSSFIALSCDAMQASERAVV